MKKPVLFMLIFLSFPTIADVTCSGIPSAVYAGIHGPSPAGSMFWVSIPNVGTLPLGMETDDMAKARFSLAQTAFVSKNRFILKYYNHTSCAEASADKAIPTYAAMAD